MGSTFVLGGARSGKSSYAELRAAAFGQVTYIATGIGHDDDPDWQERIDAHRKRRPLHWLLIETNDLPDAIESAEGVPLIDCLTLWLANVLDALDAWDQPRSVWGQVLDEKVDKLLASIGTHNSILVSNEIGQGVHPESRAGRLFQDELGRLNIRVASACEEVVFVVAGIPTKLKG
jgi:adenosylcobinamide kinase/adenosylcobinamide-phosphate guanylyltransferase